MERHHRKVIEALALGKPILKVLTPYTSFPQTVYFEELGSIPVYHADVSEITVVLQIETLHINYPPASEVTKESEPIVQLEVVVEEPKAEVVTESPPKKKSKKK